MGRCLHTENLIAVLVLVTVDCVSVMLFFPPLFCLFVSLSNSAVTVTTIRMLSTVSWQRKYILQKSVNLYSVCLGKHCIVCLLLSIRASGQIYKKKQKQKQNLYSQTDKDLSITDGRNTIPGPGGIQEGIPKWRIDFLTL